MLCACLHGRPVSTCVIISTGLFKETVSGMEHNPSMHLWTRGDVWEVDLTTRGFFFRVFGEPGKGKDLGLQEIIPNCKRRSDLVGPCFTLHRLGAPVTGITGTMNSWPRQRSRLEDDQGFYTNQAWGANCNTCHFIHMRRSMGSSDEDIWDGGVVIPLPETNPLAVIGSGVVGFPDWRQA